MSSLNERIKREKFKKHRSSDESLNNSTKKQRTNEPFSLETPLEFVDSANLGPDISNLCEEWESKDSNQAKNNFQETFNKELGDTSSGSSVSSYSDSSDDDLGSSAQAKCDVKKLQSQLRKWAIKHKVKPDALTPLLGILRRHKCFQLLPKDSKGLLESPRSTTNDFNTLANLVKQQGQQIAQLNTSVKRLANSLTRANNSVEEDPFCNEELVRSLIPLKTTNDLDVLESLLDEQDNVVTLTKILGRIGGKDVNKCVRRILRDLVEDEIAVNFSWLGRKGKNVWSGLKLNTVVSNAVRVNFQDSTNQEIENAIKDWLRGASARISRAKGTE